MSKSKEQKREEARIRKESYDKLTIQQKIKRLDEKFGVGKGASRERNKLMAKLKKEN